MTSSVLEVNVNIYKKLSQPVPERKSVMLKSKGTLKEQ